MRIPIQTRVITCEDTENSNFIGKTKIPESSITYSSITMALNEMYVHIRMNTGVALQGGNFYFKMGENERPILIFATKIRTEQRLRGLHADEMFVLGTMTTTIMASDAKANTV